MNAKTFNQFGAASEIVVVGCDPEMADYSNPRGERYGLAAYVVAINDYGDTRQLPVGVFACKQEAEAAAEKLAAALQNRFDKLGKPPVGFDRWVAGRAIYGSDAYVEYGQADDVAWEARVEEDAAIFG